jgi:hypothetical protein
VTALSVAMAWLYAKTNGSLLLVMLMHAAVNNTKDIVPSVGTLRQKHVWVEPFRCCLAHHHHPVDLLRVLPRSNAEIAASTI